MLHACPLAPEKAHSESLLGQATDSPGSSCLQTSTQNNAAQTLPIHVKPCAKPCTPLPVGSKPSQRASLEPRCPPGNVVTTSPKSKGFVNESSYAYLYDAHWVFTGYPKTSGSTLLAPGASTLPRKEDDPPSQKQEISSKTKMTSKIPARRVIQRQAHEDTTSPGLPSLCLSSAVPSSHWSAPGRKEENYANFPLKSPGATNRENCPREPARERKTNIYYQNTWNPSFCGARIPLVPASGPANGILVFQTTCENVARMRLFKKGELRAQKHERGNPPEIKECGDPQKETYPRLLAPAGHLPEFATAWPPPWAQAHIHGNFSKTSGSEPKMVSEPYLIMTAFSIRLEAMARARNGASAQSTHADMNMRSSRSMSCQLTGP